MTTNNYATTFINMAGQDGTRSIVDLEKEIEANGYINLTTNEINKYIEYKEYIATNNANVNNILSSIKEASETLINTLSESDKNNKEYINNLVSSIQAPKTVTGNEVD